MSLILTTGTVTKWDLPNNAAGSAVDYVGSPGVMWDDGDTATYAVDTNEFLVGGDNKMGYACADMPGLPLTVEDAEQVASVYVTWTAWYSGDMPENYPGQERVWVTPVLTRGRAMNYGHNLKPRDMYSWDTDSINLTTEPQTFTREMISDGGGAGGWKTTAEVLSSPDIYVDSESLDPDTYFVQMRTRRQLTDHVDDEQNNIGTEIVVYISDVQITLADAGPTPLTVVPGQVTMEASWGAPLDEISSEVRIGDPVTVQGEEPISIEAGDGFFMFEGLEPETTYMVGARSILSSGPTAWVEVEATTTPSLGGGSPVDPGVYYSNGDRWLPLIADEIGGTEADLLAAYYGTEGQDA